MNAIQDLLIAYMLIIAAAPIPIIWCINGILGQIVKDEGSSTVYINNGVRIELNWGSYFCVLVLVLIGVML